MEEQELLRKMLRLEAVFYDIGANIGFYSTLAGRMVGDQGRVYAFEPLPISAQACRENAERNGFSHVSVVEAAVGDRDGEVELEQADFSAGHRLKRNCDGGGLKVRLVSIDCWRALTGAPPPDVVMIDVEGAEIDALQGMMETIAASRPVFLIGVHWLGLAFTDFVRESLEPLGYRLTTYAGEQIPSGPTRYHALLVPEEASRWKCARARLNCSGLRRAHCIAPAGAASRAW